MCFLESRETCVCNGSVWGHQENCDALSGGVKRWTWGAEPPSPRSLGLREVVAGLQPSAKALHGLGICSCLLVIIVLCDEQRVFLRLALYTKGMGKEWADRAAEGGHQRAGKKTAFWSVWAHRHHRVMLYCVPPTVLARKTRDPFLLTCGAGGL